MFRRWFLGGSAIVVIGLGVGSAFWLPLLWAFVVVGPLVLLGLADSFQRRHTILRNFPLIGRGRFLFELVRPEIQQYFVESDIDGRPIPRELRSVVYQRAKGELETVPFGTQRDVYRTGYEWMSHSLAPTLPLEAEPRLSVGGPDCTKPYVASRLNVSAMSFGALSSQAITALNQGARRGNFAHNTGEGGISPCHRQGGDLIWQIGTAYFGCRTPDGRFDAERFADTAADDAVRMIELKLSQGAKPGHGGILPAVKVTPTIAKTRGVPVGQTVFSPPGHSAFCTPRGLIQFVARLRELAGGKPVGFKLCVGLRTDVFAIAKAMLAEGTGPDFVSVDGGEGGTGAAPLEFANSVGMPAREGLILVASALRGIGWRDRVRLFASGKIITGFHMIRALALGADACSAARGMMLALGCIQALRCNNNTCPTGIATQNAALAKGLHIGDKAERVYRYHKETVRSLLELLAAIGVKRPEDVRPHHIFRRIDDLRVRHYGELYDFLEPGQLTSPGDVPEAFRTEWEAADADSWTQIAEPGCSGGRTARLAKGAMQFEL